MRPVKTPAGHPTNAADDRQGDPSGREARVKEKWATSAGGAVPAVAAASIQARLHESWRQEFDMGVEDQP